MAKATGLIFLLYNVASARKVPFALPLYMQCIFHGLTMALLCVPFIFVHHKKCRLHVIASICYGNRLVVATLITKVLFEQLLICTAE